MTSRSLSRANARDSFQGDGIIGAYRSSLRRPVLFTSLGGHPDVGVDHDVDRRLRPFTFLRHRRTLFQLGADGQLAFRVCLRSFDIARAPRSNRAGIKNELRGARQEGPVTSLRS